MENNIKVLSGTSDFEGMVNIVPFSPFDNRVVDFLDRLSKRLLKSPESRLFPEISTFAFFCRKANVNILKRSYEGKISNSLGRGVSFHIGPSNVPINFAYSLVAGLLAGNTCIVRASSKPFEQTKIICEAITEALNEVESDELIGRISIVQYGHSHEINSYFSKLCDVRIIWGGDNSISEIRNAKLPSRSNDITFADRYSLCIISAAEYLKIQHKERVANDFYNDTYLFDQNACSSPRLIYWVGNQFDIEESKLQFWGELHQFLIKKQYNLLPIVAVDKYLTSCKAAIDHNDVRIIDSVDNLISRIELKTLENDLPTYVCAGGSFFEYSDENLERLSNIVTRKFQTVSYIGMDKSELIEFFLHKGTVGVDRVVPCGKAADFSLIWDGYDLILNMSRIVTVY